MISFDERFQKEMDELRKAKKGDSYEYDIIHMLSCYDVIRRAVMTYYPYDTHERWEQTIQTVAQMHASFRMNYHLEEIEGHIEASYEDCSMNPPKYWNILTRIHQDLQDR